MEMIALRECEVCKRARTLDEHCEQPKNGYCLLFRLQAILDREAVNMAQPKNPHFEEIRGKF